MLVKPLSLTDFALIISLSTFLTSTTGGVSFFSTAVLLSAGFTTTFLSSSNFPITTGLFGLAASIIDLDFSFAKASCFSFFISSSSCCLIISSALSNSFSFANNCADILAALEASNSSSTLMYIS